MVALGLVEVAIVPADVDTEICDESIDSGWYDATVDPFPVYDHPADHGPNKLVKYIEVTKGANFQFDLVLNSGLFSTIVIH